MCRIALLSFFVAFLATTHSVIAQYHFTVTWPNPNTHLFHIELTTEISDGAVTTFQIPEWRPGSYELKNYAAGVVDFAATDQQGNALDWKKVTINDWEVSNPTSGKITIRYKFYANKMDAGSSVLNEEQAYINGINMFMHVKDGYQRSAVLTFPDLASDWKVATALTENGRGSYSAGDYHELVDAPLIISPTLKTLHFEESGVDYYIHIQGNFGAGKEGEDLMVENTRKIVQEQQALFGGVPFEAYHFLFQFVPAQMGHAVEHANSSCYALGEAFVQTTQYFPILFNVVSHEFFHLWNVKRVRPAALTPYDYQQRPFTGLHWFTEGVTSYYADLMLVRSGIMDRNAYYQSLARVITQMESNHAEKVISPYQASMDSWLGGSDYAAPDRSISYYSLGHRLGAFLDLEIRARSGQKGLDDVFIYLFREYFQNGKGVPEDGVQKACETVTGKSFADFFARHADGTARLDIEGLLGQAGLEVNRTINAQRGMHNFGVSKSEEKDGRITIERVIPESDAFHAGIREGMVVVAIDGKPLSDNALTTFLQDAVFDTIKLGLEDGSELSLKWTGKHAQYSFMISESESATPAQTALRDGWLNSKQ